MKKMMKALKPLLLLLPLSLTSCGSREVKITVSNDTGARLGARIVEVPAEEVLKKLDSKGFVITDSEGREIPSQLTYDSTIIFLADVGPWEKEEFTVIPCDTIPHYAATVAGEVYEKRRDDISYENELVGFRIYGPGTQQARERAFGYDIFFKHPSEEIILPRLYAPETDDAVWAKVDSLRAIDNVLAEEFIKSFSYHIDHGFGMDCYAVGPTLGAGVAAIATPDSIYYPWCYEKGTILDNGPLRFTLALDFAPVDIDGDTGVTEHRLITLDSRSHLNRTKVWYTGLTKPHEIVAGFPLRDETQPVKNLEKNFIAYSDPTQGPDNGRALLGVVFEDKANALTDRDNHVLISRNINPADTLNYMWGFAWDRADILSLADWAKYLETSTLNYTVKID